MSEHKRVALITGASQGIGAGLLAAFRGAGYAVVGTSRSIAAADEPDHFTVRADVSDPQDALAVVERTLERFGRIDSLINNAGVFIGKPFADYTPDDLDALIAVNLAGFFHVTQLAIAQMVSQGSGHIVNISTSIVDRPSHERPAGLVALTKGGLPAVTRSLAIEYAPHGIRVNAVAPGIVRTPAHDPASYEGLAALHPLGRLAEVEDITDAILYLDRATFVTGETLHVDGGQAAGR